MRASQVSHHSGMRTAVERSDAGQARGDSAPRILQRTTDNSFQEDAGRAGGDSAPRILQRTTDNGPLTNSAVIPARDGDVDQMRASHRHGMISLVDRRKLPESAGHVDCAMRVLAFMFPSRVMNRNAAFASGTNCCDLVS